MKRWFARYIAAEFICCPKLLHGLKEWSQRNQRSFLQSSIRCRVHMHVKIIYQLLDPTLAPKFLPICSLCSKWCTINDIAAIGSSLALKSKYLERGHLNSPLHWMLAQRHIFSSLFAVNCKMNFFDLSLWHNQAIIWDTLAGEETMDIFTCMTSPYLQSTTAPIPS